MPGMTRWMIQPRQYGKTYRVREWFMEAPEYRVVLMSTENLAGLYRHEWEEELAERLDGDIRQARSLLRRNVRSWRSWERNPVGWKPAGVTQIAIEDVQFLLSNFVRGGSVAFVTAAGRNDEPDPEIKEQVDEFNKRMAEAYGPDWAAEFE